MFTHLSRYLGVLTVEEIDGVVKISGIPIKSFFRDVDKVWKTSVATRYMFQNVSSSYFEIQSFFLPDFWYTLDLIENYRNRFTKDVTLLKLRNALLENTWIDRLDQKHRGILNLSKANSLSWKPLAHQSEFLQAYDQALPRMNLTGMLLAAKAGSGKTFATLLLSECLEAKVSFLIVPNNSLDRVWRTTLEEVYGISKDLYWISNGTEPLKMGKRFYVFHYEALSRATEFVRANPKLATMKPFIGVDECQNFNDIGSIRTQLLVKLHVDLNCQASVWGSGTPFKALGREVIPFLRANDPLFTDAAEEVFLDVFGKSSTRALSILAHRIGKFSFKVPDHVVTGGRKPIVQTVQVTIPNPERYTLPVVMEDMRTYVHDRLEYYADAMPQIENDFHHWMEVFESTPAAKSDPDAYHQYREYIEEIRQDYKPGDMKHQAKYCSDYENKVIIPALDTRDRKSFRWVKSRYKYVRLVVVGEALGNVLGKRRQECFSEMVKHIDFVKYISGAVKKTVIFTDYVPVAKAAESTLQSIGYKTLIVYQETNRDLPRIMDTFFKRPEYNPLIATIQSLSTAVPITAANNVIFLNQPFRSIDKTQAIARVARLGQDEQTYVWDMLLDTGNVPNLSTRSADIMEWSRKQVAVMMGEESELDTDDNQFLEMAFTQSEPSSFKAKLSELLRKLSR